MSSYDLLTMAALKKQTIHKFQFVSFFAGGGGSSTGYRMAGGIGLAANEFIPEAVNTYRSNWPTTTIFEDDIRKISPDELLKKIGKEKGSVDLLDGSPPCSAFSTAGRQHKNWGKTKTYSDTVQENVEDLFFDYIRMIRGIMPRVFIAENVSGLIKGKSKGYFNDIIRKLRASGYVVSCKVLDAKWLGVPQSRARVIFIGVRSDLWREEWRGNLHPKPKKTIVTLREAFEGLVFTDKDRQDTDTSKYAIHKELIKMKPGGQSEKYFSLVKASPESYSPTLTASSHVGTAGPKHWENRGFTVAEAKRIMSIPDDYILTGTYKQQMERIGRMVAPLMYKSVCENLINIGVLGENS